MAAPVEQSADSWSLLEERIRRVVELVEELRGERDAALNVRGASSGELEALRAEVARLKQENESLRGEREKVRGRLEKLLGQLDALGA